MVRLREGSLYLFLHLTRGCRHFLFAFYNFTTAIPLSCTHERCKFESYVTCPLCTKFVCRCVPRQRARPKRSSVSHVISTVRHMVEGEDSDLSSRVLTSRRDRKRSANDGYRASTLIMKKGNTRVLKSQLPARSCGVSQFYDQQDGFLKLLTRVMEEAAIFLVPGDLERFVEEYNGTVVEDLLVHSRAVDGIFVASRRSVENRVLRGVLCTKYSATM